MGDKSKIKIAFLSTFPPRHCGIATFTQSLVETLGQFYVEDELAVLAVSDEKGLYQYPGNVIYEIDQFDERTYARAADLVNSNGIEVVSLQHEYGIFGGDDGEYILKFLENVNKPVVTNFHSVLAQHSEHRRKLTQRILDLSDSVIVMTTGAKKIISENFAVDPKKLKIVPHGVPNVRFDDKGAVKKKLGLSGRTVLSTFGLINRGKGIEHALAALPGIIKGHPEILYLVIGATHPDIIKREGESYRRHLEQIVHDLSLDGHVRFIGEFLKYEDLVNYLLASDIYLAPQLDFNQSFSGTLSYALGCGCAAISSPTAYAKELLANGRGLLVEPQSAAISEGITNLLSNSNLIKTQLKSYQYVRGMIWPQVGLLTLRVFELNLYVKKEKWSVRLPDFSERPSLEHLKNMTTDLGLVQHAIGIEPDFRFGYSIDDQARALLVSLQYREIFGNRQKIDDLVSIYFSFIERAVDEDGVIHNFLDKNFHYADQVASDVAISRSFWALAYLSASAVPTGLKKKAVVLRDFFESRTRNRYTHQVAYNLIGLSYFAPIPTIKRAAGILVDRFRENAEADWRWFENKLTWGNGIIPYALVRAYAATGDQSFLEVALEATDFLERVSRRKDVPTPIGQDGWYQQGHKRAYFDQQPIEAADMVLLYNELYSQTGEEKYQVKAQEWMGWFFGNNTTDTIMYNNLSHGVYDGLTRTGYNKNQGAESIVVYLLAYLSFSAQKRH